MSKIKDMFAELSEKQREALMLAFNECRDHIVIFESGEFIACNLTDIRELTIYQKSENGWICGVLKDE